MTDPPLLEGAVQDRSADALPAETAKVRGAPGAVMVLGVTLLEAVELSDVPTAFVAVTVNV